jgi:DNA polymerase-4
MLRKNRKPGATIRLLGVNASGLEADEGQLNLLAEPATDRWRKALSAVDHIRDKFGEQSVSLASGLRGRFRERVHENPAGLPGKDPKRAGKEPKQAGREPKQAGKDPTQD